MGLSIRIAWRYLVSARRLSVLLATSLGVLGVALGTMALITAVGVTSGFRREFRDKVLGVNAHVLVMRYAGEFHDYRDVMERLASVPGVRGIAPFTINPMMVTHGANTSTGVQVKGVDPALVGSVLDLPKQLVEGGLGELRRPGAEPPKRRAEPPRPLRRRFGLGAGTPRVEDGGLEERARDEALGTLGAGASRGTLAPDALDDAGAPSGLAPEDSGGRGLSDPTREPEAAREPDTMREPGAADAPSTRLQAAIRRAVEGTTAPSAAPTDAAPSEAAAASDDDVGPLGAAARLEPSAGFGSVLPETDVLPLDVGADPCGSADSTLPGIAIGTTLREDLGVQLGDCVQVTSPTIGFHFAGGRFAPPVAKQFRVVAVFDAGFDQYDAKFAYVDLYEAQAFHEGGDLVTGVEMSVDDVDAAPAVRQEVDRVLGDATYQTLDWEELNHGLFTALALQQLITTGVLALIVLVAAFTVVATIIMMVLEKKQEIAVLKAMGATEGEILRLFLFMGACIGLVGTLLGLAGGWATSRWLGSGQLPLDPKVYFVSAIPVHLSPGAFLWTGAFALGVCLVATIWPALYAARLLPAEALRDQ